MAEYTKIETARAIICDFCNQLYSDEPCEPADCDWLRMLEEDAADVAPVVHGRWKLLHKGGWNSVFVCSVCGRREVIVESEAYNSALKMPKKYPYCHCGARMDGDAE